MNLCNVDHVCFLGQVRTHAEFDALEQVIAAQCLSDKKCCAFVNSHEFRSLKRCVLYGIGSQRVAMWNEGNLCVRVLDSGMLLVCVMSPEHYDDTE